MLGFAKHYGRCLSLSACGANKPTLCFRYRPTGFAPQYWFTGNLFSFTKWRVDCSEDGNLLIYKLATGELVTKAKVHEGCYLLSVCA